FEIIIPTALKDRFMPMAQTFSKPKAGKEARGNTFDFLDVDSEQVLEIYGDIIGRKLTGPLLLKDPFTFRTATPLTKAEAIHAFDVMFALHGVKAVNVGDDSFKMVPFE